MSETNLNLDDLRKATLLSGQLSSVHMLNLKNYPFVFFDGIKEVTIDYNVITNDPNGDVPFISYHIKTSKKKVSNAKERMDALRESIHTLLWTNIKVSVYVNGSEKSL